MKFVSLVLFISLEVLSFAQIELQQKEQVLNERLLNLRSAKTDEEMDRLNTVFKKEMEAFLKSALTSIPVSHSLKLLSGLNTTKLLIDDSILPILPFVGKIL